MMKGKKKLLLTALAAVAGVSSQALAAGIVSTQSSFETEGILVNISTRGYVGTGDNVMIAGFCVAGAPLTVVVRALGPSLASRGVAQTLPDPMFEIRDPASGGLYYSNDDWVQDSSASYLRAIGAQPQNSKEAAAIVTAYPGCYTIIVKGARGATGVGLVEVFDITELMSS
ncbi:MAG: hypothetical protein QXY99_04465 [Thermoproteota archaeon]